MPLLGLWVPERRPGLRATRVLVGLAVVVCLVFSACLYTYELPSTPGLLLRSKAELAVKPETRTAQVFDSSKGRKGPDSADESEPRARELAAGWVTCPDETRRPGPSAPQAAGPFVTLAIGHNPVYAFFGPLTALIWLRLLQWTPIVFLVGMETSTWATDPQLLTVKRYLTLFGVQAEWIRVVVTTENLPGNDVLLSQCLRSYAAMVPGLRDDAVLVTTDIDLWPVDPAAFQAFFEPLADSKDLVILDAASYPLHTLHGVQFRELAMSHIGMNVKTWRTVMGYKEQLDPCDIAQIPSRLNEDLQRDFDYGRPGQITLYNGSVATTQWYFDQLYIGHRVHQWALQLPAPEPPLESPLDHPRIKQVFRHVETDRIDYKGSWTPGRLKGPKDLAGVLDAHLLRPGYDDDNWKQLRLLLGLLGLAEEDLALVDDFARDFKRVKTRLENQT